MGVRLVAYLTVVWLVGAVSTRAADRVHATIVDQADPREWDETTSIVVNGETVARFHLDAAHPSAQADIALPRAPSYDYALCGRITILKPDGSRETHVIDTGGTLAEMDGKTFQALAAADFTVFYLAEGTGPRPAGLHRTRACDVPTA